jgi:hypothetical protein
MLPVRLRPAGRDFAVAPIRNDRKKEVAMTDTWEGKLACALQCPRCGAALAPSDERILSVYDHEPICMACKKAEEVRIDYEAVAKQAIGQCMAETEVMYSDPQGYCYHHFYPFKCA